MFACTAVVRCSSNLFFLQRFHCKIKEQNLQYSFSVTDTNSKTTYSNLSSFSIFMYILTQFLEDQRENIFKSQHQSCFHWLLWVCLCAFSSSTAVFAVQAILVDVEGHAQADGFSSCKLQDQLSGRLSEVGSWQPNGVQLL